MLTQKIVFIVMTRKQEIKYSAKSAKKNEIWLSISPKQPFF